MKQLIEACDPFRRTANIIDALPGRIRDDIPLRDVMPGIWPTVGDIRKLRDALTASAGIGQRHE